MPPISHHVRSPVQNPEKLQSKPKRDEKDCRNRPKNPKEYQRHQRFYLIFWKKYKIAAQYSGYGPRSADSRNGLIDGGERVKKRGSQSAGQIKKQKFQTAKLPLQAFSENPEKKHIPQKVRYIGMKKKRRKSGKNIPAGKERIGKYAIQTDKAVQLGISYKKNDRARNDQKNGDPRCCICGSRFVV